jgi:citrate synthase
MINKRRLTSAEAAKRLGVKPATLYAYVSRGLLSRERTPAGSTFDAQEVERLARSSRRPYSETSGGNSIGVVARRHRNSSAGATDPVFLTELTLIQNGRFFYRGLDAVELSRSRPFEEVASWLWSEDWSSDPPPWQTPATSAHAVTAVLRSIRDRSTPAEQFALTVVAAALTDELRHDLSRTAVRITGRSLVAVLVDSIPVLAGRGRARRSDEASISERLWARLSRLPLNADRKAVLEAALVLSADHELAPSTLAARVAASFRADPYAVVATGLGPTGGTWRPGTSGAPSEVEDLLREALASDPERAIGDRLRRSGSPAPGFGMPLYPAGDPRGRELLARLAVLDGRPERHRLVERVVQIGHERGFPPPNVDLGLGALAFGADMIPGAAHAIATIGKVVGWLAHAMEEYDDPTRFRTRAAYLGRSPALLDEAARPDQP